MSCFRLLADNVLSNATLNVSPALNASLPSANLWINRRSRFARTSGATAQVLTFVFPAAVPVDALYIKTGAACTGMVQMYSDAAQVTQVYDSGVGTNLRYPVYAPAVLSVRSIKVTLTAVSTALGYIDIYHVIAGQAISPGFGHDWGATITPKTGWELRRTLGGSPALIGPATSWREMALKLSWITDAERARVAAIASTRGVMLIDPYSTLPGTVRDEHLILGYLTPAALQRDALDQSSVGLVLAEL